MGNQDLQQAVKEIQENLNMRMKKDKMLQGVQIIAIRASLPWSGGQSCRNDQNGDEAWQGRGETGKY